MGKILCATRGGEASVRTQEAAIARAKQQADDLIFFYVVDVEFLALANYALRPDVVADEMEKMAEFLLAMAVERAAREGIEARTIIRHGHFVEVLKATIREEGITLVVLGRPEEGESHFKLAQLESLARSIEKETGVQTWIPAMP